MYSFDQPATFSGESSENMRAYTESMRTLPITEAEPLNLGNMNEVMLVTFRDSTKGVYKPKSGEDADLRAMIPVGTYYLRERAAYEVDKFFGLSLVPPTVIREEGVSSGIGSIQKFEEGQMYDDVLEDFKNKAPGIDDARWELFEASNNLATAVAQYDALEIKKKKGAVVDDSELKTVSEKIDVLRDAMAARQRDLLGIEEAAEKLFEDKYRAGFMKLWLFDLVIHNTDRHINNFLLRDDGQVVAIDNGLCFNGTEFKIFRNFFGEKIPQEIAQPLLDLAKRPDWPEELKKILNGLLSEKEIANCISRIQKILEFLNTDGIIPLPEKIGKYSILSSDIKYFECYQTEEYT